MKKTLLIILMFALSYALEINVYTCGASVDGTTGDVTFDICADTDGDIAGLQFDFDPGSSGFEITSVGGGAAAAAGFTLSNGPYRVLGFSFTGAVIPGPMGGEGTDAVLLQITGPFTDSSETTVGPLLEEIAFTGSDAGGSTVTVESSQWDGGATLDGSSALPSVYSLREAYPNPFNPTTTIDYTLRENGNVSIVIYDLMGRIVKELVNEFQFSDGGTTHSVVWNGTDRSGNMVSSGIYIYRMVSNDFTKSHRITLMK